MELGGNDVIQEKANPDKDKGDNLIFNASVAPASPHYTEDRLICSTVVVLSCPVNLVNSGDLYWLGIGIKS